MNPAQARRVLVLDSRVRKSALLARAASAILGWALRVMLSGATGKAVVGKVEGGDTGGRLLRVALCALVLVVAAVYWQVGTFGANDFDDGDYVFSNPHVNTGLSISNVKWALAAFHAGNWHPATWISHMLDVSLFGLNPGAHHLSNAGLHLANSILLFFLLRAATGSAWRSLFVAALFALHPVNVESVAWISERKNTLSAAFWFLTLLAYVSYCRRGGASRYIGSLTLFTIGLAAKPMLVTLPVVLLMMDFWPLRRFGSVRWLRLLVEKTPYAVLSAASCWITLLAQSQGGMTRTLEQFPVGERVANAFVAYCSYLRVMFWPQGLCVLYPHPEDTLPVWITVSCACGLGVVTAAAVMLGRKRPYVAVGWFWYVVSLLPVIGLVQVGPQGMADRYAYVPFTGLFVIAAWLIPDTVGPIKSRWLAVPAVGVLAALGLASWVQAGYWRTADTVFQRALQVTGSHRSVIYCRVGALAQAGRTDQALDVLRDALRGSREPEVVRNYMGMILARAGRTEEAVAQYRAAIKLSPSYAVAHNNLGTALARLGRAREAERHLRLAIRLDPGYAEPHHSLGVLLYEQGRVNEAVAEWKKALRLKPGLGAARARLRAVERE